MGLGSVMGKIFISEKSVEQSIDAVTKGLDKIWYTKEEQADAEEARWKARHDAQVKTQDMLLDWVKGSQGHNIARRWLTVNITRVWLAQLILGMVFAVGAVWAPKVKSDQMLATAGILQGYAADNGNIVLLIVMFYFALPHMGAAMETLLSRFGIRTPPASTTPPGKG